MFYQNKLEGVVGVGHASFTESRDGREGWVVYHGMMGPMETETGWGARRIGAQRFTWSDDGSPQFPRPGRGPYVVPRDQV